MSIEKDSTIWFANNLGLIKMDKDSCLSIFTLEQSGPHKSVQGFPKIGNYIWMANSQNLEGWIWKTVKLNF